MEKEFKKTRIEIEREEEEKVMNFIHENYKRANKEYHKQQARERSERLIKEQQDKLAKEKEQKKEAILNFILVAVVILILFFMMIAMITVSAQTNEGSIEQCVAAGFPQNYCESQLGL